jgi:hypothetical protein
MATRPTTAPQAAPMEVGRPEKKGSLSGKAHSSAPHVIMAMLAAMCVLAMRRPP